jgi:hypothetical protein
MLMTNIFETIVIVRITDAHYLHKNTGCGYSSFFTFFAKVRYGWKKNTKSKDFDLISYI